MLERKAKIVAIGALCIFFQPNAMSASIPLFNAINTKYKCDSAFKRYPVEAIKSIADLEELSIPEYYYQCGIADYPDNMHSAREWLTLSAQQGLAKAMFLLGQSYQLEDPTYHDEEKAVYWYQQAAKRNDVLAQAALANQYYYGKGIRKNLKKAVYWYKQAALQNNPESQFALAQCYEKGEGILPNGQKAVEWYFKAAERGFAPTFVRLGDISYYGQLGHLQDYGQASMWYRKAAEQDDAYAQYQLGSMLGSETGVKRNPSEAIKWLTLSAEQDYTQAESLLGRLFYSLKWYKRALPWLHRAAHKKEKFALTTLGEIYRYGKGLEENPRQSIVYYRQAAALGEVQAQALLGLSYQQGLGVPKNAHLAAHWYEKAGHQGNVLAQFNLSTLYWQGKGLKKDLVKAYAWSSVAADAGLESAIEARRLISTHLTPSQIQRAQTLANELIRN